MRVPLVRYGQKLNKKTKQSKFQTQRIEVVFHDIYVNADICEMEGRYRHLNTICLYNIKLKWELPIEV